MKDWIKENWFKILCAIVLVIVAYYLIRFLDYNTGSQNPILRKYGL